MSISAFSILMILVILLIAYLHFMQGFFSATISAIYAVLATALAISTHESVVEKYLGGRMADSAHAMMLISCFVVFYFVPRIITDSFVPGNLRLPPTLDKIGAGVMGLIVGVFGAGILSLAAESLPFPASILGYSLYDSEDKEVRVPQGGRTLDRTLYGAMLEDSYAEAEQAKHRMVMIVPADVIALELTRKLSDGGSLAGSQSLSKIHPDWIQELYGQRAGMQPTVRHVLLSLPDRQKKDATIMGVYSIVKPIPSHEGDYDTFVKRKLTPLGPKPSSVPIVVRVAFDFAAADAAGGTFIRISPGSVRLVLPHKDPGTGEVKPTDYYPTGTLYFGTENFVQPVFFANRPDDYLFIAPRPPDAYDPTKTQSVADFVFEVSPKDIPAPDDKGVSKMPAESFVEVKRLVRTDLSGMEMKQQRAVYGSRREDGPGLPGDYPQGGCRHRLRGLGQEVRRKAPHGGRGPRCGRARGIHAGARGQRHDRPARPGAGSYSACGRRSAVRPFNHEEFSHGQVL